MRVYPRLLSVAAVCVPLWWGAHAKDLEALTRFLIPAYLAQNFAALCVEQDPRFLAELDPGAALVAGFAEHVKKEVTVDLAESHAANVQITAANTARHAAQQEVRRLSGQQVAVPADVFKSWCDQSAKRYIVEVMNKHREQHAEFLKRVDEAKR